MEDSIKHTTLQNSEIVAVDLQSEFDIYKQIIIELERRDDLTALFTKPTPEQGGQILFTIFSSLNSTELKGNVHLISSDNTVRLSTGAVPDEYNPVAWQKDWGIMRKMHQMPGQFTFISQEMKFSSGTKVIYSLGKSILWNKKIIGYVVIDFSAQELEKYLQSHWSNTTVGNAIANELQQVIIATGPLLNGKNSHQTSQRFNKVIENDSESYYYSAVQLAPYGLYYYEVVSLTGINEVRNIGMIVMVFTYGCLALAMTVINRRLAMRIMEPLTKLTAAMRQAGEGNLSSHLLIDTRDEFEVLGGYFNVIINEMQIMIERIQEQVQRSALAEKRQLQAQFNPHFLYNTLDVVKWLIKIKQYEDAESTVIHLAKILRYSISDTEEFVIVREDIEYISRYLQIQQIRFGTTMKYDISLDPGLSEEYIPKLILQPLIENACVHGLAQNGGGSITILWEDLGDKMQIVIRDTGVGFKEPIGKIMPEDLLEMAAGEVGFGIYNVKRRLELYYGNESKMAIESTPGNGTSIVLIIPKRRNL